MELTLIDFIMGRTSMHALPYFALGAFQVRMLSGFGFGAGAA